MAEIYWIQIWKGPKMQAKFQMIVLKINLPKNSLQFFNELENKRPILRCSLRFHAAFLKSDQKW